ncbi:MAG: hypothetical protein VST71_06650 [Nitrospirota bacterium]|nr:hypothetical protein [Nitrospirota bacterium]
MIDVEEKLLRMISLEQLSKAVRQETPVCSRCLLTIDVIDKEILAEYRDIKVGGTRYTLVEPYCPRCGRLVKAKHYIIN